MDHKLNGSNGHYDFGLFENKQEQRFDSLERVLKDGFDGVTGELKALREQGYIPISVVEKITDQQRNIIHPVIRVLCYSLIAVILWFTGLKALLPHIFSGQ
jgi:hypothetical protein